jgi:hypothetical protein
MTYGLNAPQLVICYREAFIARLNEHVSDTRQVDLLAPFVYSIDHKLNVARYNAGLIVKMNPEDYGRARFGSVKAPEFITVDYPHRCTYYAYDWDQYSVMLLYCIESFAAASFSLFDSCGYLLTAAYNLNLPREEPPHKDEKDGRWLDISFVNAHADLKRGGKDKMAHFLKQYLPSSTTISWIAPLRNLRNHTTHGQVTDIVELRAPTPPTPKSIQLRGTSISAKDDIELAAFVEQCFAGMEVFVERLYEIIAMQVREEKNLPLDGRFDDKI